MVLCFPESVQRAWIGTAEQYTSTQAYLEKVVEHLKDLTLQDALRQIITNATDPHDEVEREAGEEVCYTKASFEAGASTLECDNQGCGQP